MEPVPTLETCTLAFCSICSWATNETSSHLTTLTVGAGYSPGGVGVAFAGGRESDPASLREEAGDGSRNVHDAKVPRFVAGLTNGAAHFVQVELPLIDYEKHERRASTSASAATSIATSSTASKRLAAGSHRMWPLPGWRPWRVAAWQRDRPDGHAMAGEHAAAKSPEGAVHARATHDVCIIHHAQARVADAAKGSAHEAAVGARAELAQLVEEHHAPPDLLRKPHRIDIGE